LKTGSAGDAAMPAVIAMAGLTIMTGGLA